MPQFQIDSPQEPRRGHSPDQSPVSANAFVMAHVVSVAGVALAVALLTAAVATVWR
ncbi:hypothetical protein [Pandoraea sp. PE-S2R-1]|uniref:hypothetical protein n=1 Tax=Pandoraea sp. PE-S2R-1 TaxID=1986994 RepID=UPI001483AAA4|nr:hypothetical protein [Pandoraea sp. PE-S2R-1]